MPVAELLSEINIDADNAAQSAVACAVLFVDAIDFRRECLERRSLAKIEMERAQVEKALELRKEFRATGDRATEKNIEELTLVSPRVKQFMDNFNKADALDEYSKLVVEAFRMWRDCLRIVSDLTRNEMSAQSAVEAGAERMADVRRRLREKFPGE